MTLSYPAAGNRGPNQSKATVQSGFTLIEIIVVVAIIGVMVSVLGVRMSRDSNRLAKLEAKRFHIIVNEVRDEAILAGENYLLNVNENGHYFFTSVSERKSISDDGLFKSRSVQAGVKIEWDVFDDLFEEDDEDQDKDEDGAGGAPADDKPKVFISALGEITPFEIRFSGSQESYTVFIDDKNRLAQRDGPAGIF